MSPARGPFPYRDADDLLASHLERTSRGTRSIYASIVGMAAVALAAVPVVEVDVYVRAPGIVRPTSEKHEVVVGVAGFVDFVQLEDATPVEEGQVLLRIRATPTEARLETVEGDLARAEAAVADLRRLLTPATDPLGAALATVEYRQQARELAARLEEVDLRIEHEAREMELARRQVELDLVPEVDADRQRFALEHARSERALLLEGARRRWAEELARLQEELGALRSRRTDLDEARALHEVRSPTRGSLEEAMPLSPGSWVAAGTRVAVVSPDAELVGEVLVPPRDVGLVRSGGPVVLRIDAYDPHEWGVATGSVTSISDDALQTPSGPTFRVRTSLDRPYLELATGHRGGIRKGMTFEARFLVARRTLFQLLRDRVDDWIRGEPRGGAA